MTPSPSKIASQFLSRTKHSSSGVRVPVMAVVTPGKVWDGWTADSNTGVQLIMPDAGEHAPLVHITGQLRPMPVPEFMAWPAYGPYLLPSGEYLQNVGEIQNAIASMQAPNEAPAAVPSLLSDVVAFRIALKSKSVMRLKVTVREMLPKIADMISLVWGPSVASRTGSYIALSTRAMMAHPPEVPVFDEDEFSVDGWLRLARRLDTLLVLSKTVNKGPISRLFRIFLEQHTHVVDAMWGERASAPLEHVLHFLRPIGGTLEGAPDTSMQDAQRLASNDKHASHDDLMGYVIDMGDFLTFVHALDKVDEQSADLAREVYMELSQKMQLAENERQALNRLRNSVKRGMNGWDAGTQRNNIFKAADLLRMKLPSYMFASDKSKTAGAHSAHDDVQVAWGLVSRARSTLRASIDDIDDAESHVRITMIGLESRLEEIDHAFMSLARKLW